MSEFKILYDEPQEAEWFRGLHSRLQGAGAEAITVAQGSPSVAQVLGYDRPDIVLLRDDVPVLVVEETVEVPSGHNVGQRFARLAAAAECGVPCLYFGPYAAKKHGGKTAGPRYMNLRLFHALDAMTRVTGTVITTVNWPVDGDYEVRKDAGKDREVRSYVSAFFEEIDRHGPRGVSAALLASEMHRRTLAARTRFIAESVRNPEQYDGPPNSVEVLPAPEMLRRFPKQYRGELSRNHSHVVLYRIGMTAIRADPYTGMAMLYRYLYIAESPSRALVLWLPHISVSDWRTAARRASRKDVRLFSIAADAILFADAMLLRPEL